MSDVRTRVALSAVLAAAGALAVAGVVSLWLPLALASLLVLAAFVPRIGWFAGAGATVLVVPFGILATLIATHVARVPPGVVVVTVAVVAAGAIAWTLPAFPTRSDLARILPGLPVLLGGAIWVAVVTVAQVVPGAAHYAWAMNGDSANNLLFARVLIADGGIALGGAENPVPLTAGVIAVAMLAGRDAVPSDALLAHDLGAFVDVWTMVVAAVAVLIGLCVAVAVPADRRGLRALAGGLASLLALTWFVTGYPIEYGFLNAHLTLVAVLASWLVVARSADRPALVVGILAVAATIVLAIWAPLVLFPASLALVVILRARTRLFRASRGDLVVGIAGGMQLVLYGLVMTLPTLVQQGQFLASPGGAYPLSRWVFVALVLGVLALAVVAWRVLGPVPGLATGASAVAAATGFAVLLFSARTAPNPWLSYYPLKFSWLAAVVLVVVAVSVAIAIGTRLARTRVAGVVTVAVLAATTVVGTQAVVYSPTGYVQHDPASRVLRGDFWPGGDEAARRILELGDLSSPGLLWRSGDPNEEVIDFWLLQVMSDSMSDNLELKHIAYAIGAENDLDVLCRIVELVEPPLTIVTADPGLEKDYGDTCGELGPGDGIVLSP